MIKKWLVDFHLDTIRSLQLFRILRFSFVILTSIALAKLGLSLSEIGIYETLLFIGTAFTFFWIAGLLNGMLPVYPELDDENKPVFLFNTFLLFLLLSVLVTGFLFSSQSFLVATLTNFKVLPYYNILCLFLLFNLPTYLVEYLYLLQDRPYKILWFGLFSFGGQFLVVVIPLALGFTLQHSFIGLTILAVLKFIWLLTIIIPITQPIIRFSLLKSYLIVALPVLLYTFVGGLMEYIDLGIVSKYFDEEKLAIYRTGARELPLSLALVGAVYTALIPIVTTDLKEGLVAIKQRTTKLMPILFLSSAVLMFLTPLLFPIVWNEEFTPSATIFNIYLLLLTSRILIPQTILIGLKKAYIILWVALIEILVNLGLSLLLIQVLGLPGIALATVVAFLVEKTLLISYNYWKLKIPPYEYINWRAFIFYNFILIISFMISWMIF